MLERISEQRQNELITTNEEKLNLTRTRLDEWKPQKMLKHIGPEHKTQYNLIYL